MIIKSRTVIQWVLFAIFVVLMVIGKAQIWMGLIFLSILLAAVFGRFYCGWGCPINTLIKPATWISKKIGLGKKNVPKVLKSETTRWIVFGLFIIGLMYTIYTISIGRKFPLPLIIIPLGIITTHLVWYPFKKFGYDIDSDRSWLVTAKDIVNSPLLEVVQIYGVNPDSIWK